jgi:TolA-binding protein
VIKAASSRSRARDVAEAIPASLPSPEEMPVIKNPPVMPETVAATSPNGQKIFEQALKAFRRDDFGGALELFDRFLADSPNSPLAADANLYRAECYLKQSGL